MVAIARALMTDPRVLLLDEPSTGLAPKIVMAVFEVLPLLQAQGVSVLLGRTEPYAGSLRRQPRLCARPWRYRHLRPASELAHDQRVVDTYLGG